MISGRSIKWQIIFGLTMAIICACTPEAEESTLFQIVKSNDSGIEFINSVEHSDEFNLFKYTYFYNGAGVAAADFNNDGLDDLYFTGNMVEPKFYLNKGNLKFQEVTSETGISLDSAWRTGIAVVDINNDGLLDFYECQVSDTAGFIGKNRLYMNQGTKEGIPIFKDMAEHYGLAFNNYSTQAYFFDIENDGDLDMYLLNHSNYYNSRPTRSNARNIPHDTYGDKLLRNDNGKFVDVSEESGIYSSALGYGLSATMSDLNNDGYVDIYVGNDFSEDDYHYLNNGDGTFTHIASSSMGHTSRFTMGADAFDANNDGMMDLITLDMLPDDPEIHKSSMVEDAYAVFLIRLSYGYGYQFARNNFQLNRGNNKFSEVALYSGLGATDWSWSVLANDYDMDGHDDLFITNGIYRRFNDLDHLKYISNFEIQQKLASGSTEDYDFVLKNMPANPLSNAFFKNNGKLEFADKNNEWGSGEPGYSNGAAYSDLDNDGDLDLVVNNLNHEAWIYENKISEQDNKGNYLKLKLKDSLTNNLLGIGAKVSVYFRGKVSKKELMLQRGFMSSVSPYLFFGLGEESKVDSIRVDWPDSHSEMFRGIVANTTLTLSKKTGKPIDKSFETFSQKIELDTSLFSFKHKENIDFYEFTREKLLPHLLSKEGPKMTIADINSDELDDLFIGGGVGQPSRIMMQGANGQFTTLMFDESESEINAEDIEAVFADLNGDGSMDLCVVSGGNQYHGNKKERQPRIYYGDGKGNFSSPVYLPIRINASCVAASDYDKDGDQDLFIGARSETDSYGIEPVSFLLINDLEDGFRPSKITGNGRLGHLKKAQWIDMDDNGYDDLVVAGEWMPITIFLNRNGNLEEKKITGLSESLGWWNDFEIKDLDKDGDLDIVAGNLGQNSKLKASNEYPVRLYVGDFEEKGNVVPVMTHYLNGKEEFVNSFDELASEMISVKKRYTSYRKFAQDSVRAVLPNIDFMGKRIATEFRSVYFENVNDTSFVKHPLPSEAQFSVVEAIEICDFNNDGNEDLILGGNRFELNPILGRYDAGFGVFLAGDGNGSFSTIPKSDLPIYIDGEVKDIKSFESTQGEFLLFSRNNDYLLSLSLEKIKLPAD